MALDESYSDFSAESFGKQIAELIREGRVVIAVEADAETGEFSIMSNLKTREHVLYLLTIVTESAEKHVDEMGEYAKIAAEAINKAKLH